MLENIKNEIIKDYYHNNESIYNQIENASDYYEVESIIENILYCDYDLSYSTMVTLSEDIAHEIIRDWIRSNVVNQVTIENAYQDFLKYTNGLKGIRSSEIDEKCVYIDIEYNDYEMKNFIEYFQAITLEKLKEAIYYNTNGLVRIGQDLYIEME